MGKASRRDRAGRRKKRLVSRGNRREGGPLEPLTVGWMLSVLTALACAAGALTVTWFVRAGEGAARIALLGDLLAFAGFIIGCISLILTAVVIKVRREPPPAPVSIFAVLAGVASVVVALFWR